MNDWIKRNTILIDKRGQATSKAHLIIGYSLFVVGNRVT